MALATGNRAGLALVILAAAAAPAALGGYLVSKGPGALPEVRAEAIAGKVVAIESRTGRRGSYYRSVVEYAVDGRTLRTASRSVYRPARHRVGDEANVLLLADGEVRLAFEWEAERASADSDRRKERWTNRLLGGLLLGCSAFALLLAAGVLRAGRRRPIDRR